MLRICLVEDEEYALKSLRQKIIDLDGPYEVVGIAYNGYDALDIISNQYPDVVITDIRMPDMDGITLIEQISTLYKNIITVIISGYQEFDYAQKAIRFHTEDYLLKPVVPNELRECLEKCEKKVSLLRNTKHIDNVFTEFTPYKWEGADSLLIYLIFGNGVFNPESFVHPSGFYIPSLDIEKRIQHMIHSPGPVLCFIGVCSNEKVVICQKGDCYEQTLEQKLSELAGDLEREHNYCVTISYITVKQASKLTTQINMCRTAAMQSALPGISRVVSQTIKSEYLAQNLSSTIHYMTTFINQMQTEALKEKIFELFTEWQNHCYTLSSIQNDLIYITNSLKHNIPMAADFEFTVVYYIENIISISGTYMDLANNYYNLVAELFEEALNSGGLAISPVQLVERIEKYFQDNLSGNITLPELCAEMNYSKVYLCRIFKKLKNTTPIDYYIQMKMQRAKNLVQDYPSMPIKDIANSLGFHDVYYFSKVFKRIVGIPPSVARDMED